MSRRARVGAVLAFVLAVGVLLVATVPRGQDLYVTGPGAPWASVLLVGGSLALLALRALVPVPALLFGALLVPVVLALTFFAVIDTDESAFAFAALVVVAGGVLVALDPRGGGVPRYVLGAGVGVALSFLAFAVCALVVLRSL